MVKVYHNGTWYPASGKKIYCSGSWITLKNNDRLRFNGNWYRLGDSGGTLFDRDAGGWFPETVWVRNYLCSADEEYDPVTGEPTISNYRWELMSTEIGCHASSLDPGTAYPEWRWYSVGEEGNRWDFSVEVDPSTGALVGPGDGLHNGRLILPEPGPGWYMDSVSIVYTL